LTLLFKLDIWDIQFDEKKIGDSRARNS